MPAAIVAAATAVQSGFGMVSAAERTAPVAVATTSTVACPLGCNAWYGWIQGNARHSSATVRQ